MQRGEELDALIAKAQAGDVRAFEALLAGHLPLLRRYARGFARSAAEADDLTQDALLKVYKSLRLFRYQSAFSSWVYAIVRNVVLDAARSRRGKESAQEEALQPSHLRGLPSGDRPDDELDRARERERLWRALRQVPIEYRSALLLFDLEGCSYDEIAAIEGIRVGTVKSRLSRGRAALRALLAEPGEPAPAADPAEAGTLAATSSSNGPRSGT